MLVWWCNSLQGKKLSLVCSYRMIRFWRWTTETHKALIQLACVQTMTKLWLVPSAKQRRDLCSGPPTDSTNYRKCVSNSPSTWLAIMTNKTKPFLTGQSWRVLKSGYTAGSPEQGFRRCFADGVNQSLISSALRLSSNRTSKIYRESIVCIE